eukprot:TRINITY_DN2832_c2_g1_i3.p1 TRINITY_DN2832_c2_g1~~TRINITY_DN2832_c2_g1_i3.p1  ORF type:complete len:125 (+),score=15.65 TRINITY_DN2832_c2_g1_i3:2-376(+)
MVPPHPGALPNRMAPPTAPNNRSGRPSHMGPNGFSNENAEEPGELPDLSTLSAMSPKDQKELVGTAIYHRIRALGHTEAMSGKITGMLISTMDISELINLLDTPANLTRLVQEALDTLKASGQQ